ncbi:hypothetical protein PC9H_009686 [Pleurotus ostreatus]|uniref:Phosphoglycerate mutase-like protein n=1 Tax=Pleurotus ostreatus TaxID=5322 RepID=A0A8H6ZPU8_PLEOS|nr:uncharacterized protein PC9H_009686 [Pleurotus ostreatus]KAF7424379.1 hypothetical protein PC9H_009686 [Pleurotus ostreatus]KAJ8692696.1 hypothetical protein PTI98_009986 [Pleurotus ostreatus]KAJ8692697.1 hypothetical protein PTI98_009986 [Pleurotus ostreatus]
MSITSLLSELHAEFKSSAMKDVGISLYLRLFGILHLLTRTSASVLADKNGVYDTSTTPPNLPWNTYNYCNAPHVNAAHYSSPKNAKLEYVNVVIRHHKRTPDNLYPQESQLNPPSGWDCTDFHQLMFPQGGGQVDRQTSNPTWHPFARKIWNGTCDQGQLTRQGFEDAIKHGRDFWNLYHQKLHFLSSVNEHDVVIRTSTEPRTQHVASGLLFGMDPSTAGKVFPIHTQPSPIDSLPPRYSCPRADRIRSAYQSVPAWSDHIHANQDLQDKLDATLGTPGLSDWSFWYDHFFDTFTSRTCGGHTLPCNATGVCVAEADARRVFAIGDFEYNYIWNAAENSTTYNQLTFGVFFQELLQNFQQFKSGAETHKLVFFVGHDGSMIRLASGLGFGKIKPLRWPALGSEIVMEVWRTSQKARFVRVLHEGTPVDGLEWLPLDAFISLLAEQVPADIFTACGAV